MYFKQDGLEEKLKKDFDNIKNLDDMKGFLFEILPRMMEADIDTFNYVLEVLQTMKLLLKVEEMNDILKSEVNKNGK